MHQFSYVRVITVFAIHIKDMFSIVKWFIRIYDDTFNSIKCFSFTEKVPLCYEYCVGVRQFIKILSCIQIFNIHRTGMVSCPAYTSPTV